MNCLLKITCFVTSIIISVSCTTSNTKPNADVPTSINTENSDCLTLKDFADDRDQKKVPTPPIRIYSEPPIWPTNLKDIDLGRNVNIKTIIDCKGQVLDAKVIKSINPDADKAALNSVLKWRFKPSTYKGKPISTAYVVSIKFTR